MNKYSISTIVILGLTLQPLIYTNLSAEVYKWIDADGNVHYSQVPPEENAPKFDIPAETVNTPPAPKKNPDTPQDDAGKKPLSEQQRAAEFDKSQKEKKQKQAEEQTLEAKKQQNCKQAKKRFNTINSGGRLYEVDESGERHYWSDTERKIKLQSAQADVDKWCSED